MTRGAGVLRSAVSLAEAAELLVRLRTGDPEEQNLLDDRRALVQAAAARLRVARHAHPRRPPGPVAGVPRAVRVHRPEHPEFVPLPVPEPAP